MMEGFEPPVERLGVTRYRRCGCVRGWRFFTWGREGLQQQASHDVILGEGKAKISATATGTVRYQSYQGSMR